MAKTLTIFLAADVSKLNRGLNSARSDMTGLSGTLDKLLGPALIGAGIAAAGLAVKLGIDGVKAAVEDEAAMKLLAQTLENVGLAHDTAPIEEYIRSLERTLGIADTELRPAYDRLVRSTRDTEEANRALQIALDVSAGSGKSLDAVVQALGRAYDGNTQGLSRLGAGIDATILKTGDMNQITAALSSTFQGQAANSATTYEGQIRRLSTAADNMKEAFGAGLLKALGDTDKQTQGLVDTMEALEPILEGTGVVVGTFTKTALGNLDKNLGITAESTKEVAEATAGFNKIALIAGGFVQDLTGAFIGANSPIQTTAKSIGKLSGDAAQFNQIISATVQGAIDAGNAIATIEQKALDTAAALRESYKSFLAFAQATASTTRVTADQAERTATATTRVNSLTESNNSYTGSSRGAATATQVTTDKLAAQSEVLKGLNSQLQQQTRDLESATGAIATYAQGVADQITRGFDLSAGLTITDGQANAAEWLSGVDAEVAKYQWFGNVLAEIQRQGGPELREYFASLGADVGGEMGQAAIDGGLVPQLASKLAEVQQAAYEVGQAFVSESDLAGEEYALGLVNGTIGQIAKEEKRLRQIGKNIGKPIGANIKAEIAQAVSDAIKAAEASRTAALAEISAREAATTAGAVEQATAQSLARLIRNSDNRAGRNVQPVLA